MDLVGARLDFMINSLPLLLPQAETGKIKPIAVTTAQRAAAAPEVPTGDAVGTTAEQFAAVIRADIEKWTRLVRTAGLNAE